MTRALRSSLIALVLAAVVVSGAACRFFQAPATSLRLEAETTAAVTASGSAEATRAAEVTQAAAAAAAEPAAIVPLDEDQAAALESELKAIERELDSLDLPSDKDFEGIESDLP